MFSSQARFRFHLGLDYLYCLTGVGFNSLIPVFVFRQKNTPDVVWQGIWGKGVWSLCEPLLV